METLMIPTIVHEDHWGSIIDHPDRDTLELRWFDSTAAFTGETFNDRQAIIAGALEQSGRHLMLIDAVQFGMRAEEMDVEHRDTHTIPRFNAAGLRKIALIVPADFPMIGMPPAPEGPSDHPTAFFATRADATAWLTTE